ncbi:uncharacterized protein LOC126850147 [Cataglyphis hispanica]|uniref:uncharacterized protein LOC126850147 n=1 Tax=Cataglyphis hispanica TaxID=1086592 RepID=UPI00217FB603|nr:uncharacterized protein LOC126850147 [Cataglyphis hispanica]
MYGTMEQPPQQHSFEDRSRLADRNREGNAGYSMKARTDNGLDRDRTPRNYANDANARPLRILGRRYSLMKTGYKHLEICINVSRPSFVEIVLRDNHGKEISLMLNTWKELLYLRSTLASYFQSDKRDETRSPAPIYIGQLMLRQTEQSPNSPSRDAQDSTGYVEKHRSIHIAPRTLRQLPRYVLELFDRLHRQQAGSFPRSRGERSRPRARSRDDTRQRELRPRRTDRDKDSFYDDISKK